MKQKPHANAAEPLNPCAEATNGTNECVVLDCNPHDRPLLHIGVHMGYITYSTHIRDCVRAAYCVQSPAHTLGRISGIPYTTRSVQIPDSSLVRGTHEKGRLFKIAQIPDSSVPSLTGPQAVQDRKEKRKKKKKRLGSSV
jgi:hypothetical protein